MAEGALLQLTIAIALAALLATLMRVLRQPTVVAYVLSGIVLGYIGLFHWGSLSELNSPIEIGTTLLLFLVGLDFNLKELRHTFGSATANALLRAGILGLLGYFAGTFIGLSSSESIYLALILTFSSTIVGIKLMSERGAINSAHGKLAIGTLIVQDILAIIAITVITSSGHVSGASDLGLMLVKVIVLTAGIIFLTQKQVLTNVFKSVADNIEITFVVTIAWALGLAAIVSSPFIGLSPAIGGFLAGLSLSNSWERFEIAGRIKPLKDIFVLLFFIVLGLEITREPLQTIAIPALIIVVVVCVIGPLVTMVTLPRQSLPVKMQTAAALMQLSEFGLIIGQLGFQQGAVTSSTLTMITLATVTTMLVSSYGYAASYKLIKLLPYIPNRKSAPRFARMKEHIVLVGAHRIGGDLVDLARDKKLSVVVIEQNPKIFEQLKDSKIAAIFGNATDSRLLQEAGIERAKILVITSPIPEENEALIVQAKKLNPEILVVGRASYDDLAENLYAAGADLVLIPSKIGGVFLANLLHDKRIGRHTLQKAAVDQKD